MNKNILIVLGGGFLIAVLVAVMVQASLSGSKKKQVAAAKPEAQVMLVVASKDLKPGDELSEENMKWQEWPKSGVFPGAVVREKKEQKVSEALSGKVQNEILTGEPIIASAIIKEGSNRMAAQLREGMRAISIDIKPSTGVAGLIAPGDRVDLILNYSSRIKYEGDDTYIKNMIQANFSKTASETIIENVRVLAVDRRMSATEASGSGEGKKVTMPKTVTLEVTPKGAEVIAVARKAGTLSLALRGLGDDVVSDAYTPATTDARITHIWDEIYATMEKMANDNSGQGSNFVRVYHGEDANAVVVQP